MAVDINLTPIGSGFNRAVINDNFNSIEVALTEVLGRNGVTPNQMNSDIDLNGNDILNVGDIDVQSITIAGETFLPDSVIAQGPPGDDATVTVGTVTTGAAGTSVIITNVGTASGAILDFTIPRGDTGASGAGTGDMLAAQNLNDVASKPTAFANIKQAATTSASGVVELATNAETITGTDATRGVTPAGLAAVLATLGGQTNVQTFTASGTWTKPAFGTFAYIEVWGAGGSGARGTGGGDTGGGGGGGAYSQRFMKLSDITSTVAVTIGAGGAARTTAIDGAAGGNSSFSSYVTAYGGGGGGTSSTQGGGGGGGGALSAGSVGTISAGGAGGTGFISNVGGAGGAGSSPGNKGEHGGGGGGGGDNFTGESGGISMYGGGGGAGGGAATGGAGGTSLFGGNGGASGTGGTAATAGSAPGGGGGGAETGNSGAGARGECRIYVW